MPDKAALDALVARIRSTSYSDPNDLANVIAVGLSSVARQQTFNRGLHDDAMVGIGGGTTLASDDNSAGKVSASLQQPATLGMQQMGAVTTRQQGRADQQLRTLPAVVTSVNGTGADAEVQVAIMGKNGVALAIDPSTNQLKPGDPLSTISNSDQLGQTITLSGNSFNSDPAVAGGQELPTVGQTVMVSVADTNEKRTIWINRNRRNVPRVVSYPATQGSTTMVNGLCCHEKTPDGGGGGPGGT